MEEQGVAQRFGSYSPVHAGADFGLSSVSKPLLSAGSGNLEYKVKVIKTNHRLCALHVAVRFAMLVARAANMDAYRCLIIKAGIIPTNIDL